MYNLSIKYFLIELEIKNVSYHLKTKISIHSEGMGLG